VRNFFATARQNQSQARARFKKPENDCFQESKMMKTGFFQLLSFSTSTAWFHDAVNIKPPIQKRVGNGSRSPDFVSTVAIWFNRFHLFFQTASMNCFMGKINW
jgi:hypothetical protein